MRQEALKAPGGPKGLGPEAMGALHERGSRSNLSMEEHMEPHTEPLPTPQLRLVSAADADHSTDT